MVTERRTLRPAIDKNIEEDYRMDAIDYNTCSYCVMNNRSDNTITFDQSGQCSYCKTALEQKGSIYFPNDEGKKKLEALVSSLKEAGKGKEYDCLMGLSGGLDSSYLAYLGARKWGLRIAAVHVDDGYDTEISKANLLKLCEAAEMDMITIAPDAEQYNDLTLAYMKAGVPNIAVPQDNLLFAELYSFARSKGISTFLSGGNYALECILQKGNSYTAYDLVNLYDIHKRFGKKPIDKLQFISDAQRRKDAKQLGIQSPRPLNYIDYNRDKAFEELKAFCDFQYYGRKHLENYLTAFVQLYWFPKKFNVDKRTSHLSSMIVSGQMTRDEALAELNEPLYEDGYMDKVKMLICDNMHITIDELESLVEVPAHQHDEYRTDKKESLRRSVAMLTRPLRKAFA